MRFSYNKKRLDKWHNIWIGQNDFDVPEAEAKGNQHHKTEGAIDDDCPHHGAGKRD